MNIEGMPEDERLAILESLEAQRPGSSTLAAGTLAGPATPNRPDVPIWEYASYLELHPEVDIDELVAVRFPVIFYGGDDFTIDSAAEYLRTDPVPSPTPMNLDSVIDMWRHLHAAGVVAWDAGRRAVEHRRPFDAYKAAVAEWGVRWRAREQLGGKDAPSAR
ncbi:MULTISPECIES: hypothetical protein [unclassified Frondihabitans]|uniref:hypothetical protein n=1 Tax=unclassified Frondihabitans TaxID=2626248 RepID=UPI000F5119B2|nr:MULTISPECIES: hypothetical protein [unclassified Frondihabitans]RPE78445.1 hypothetical protein EDF37_1121 [Frondihabitans sp. PhB153]RPF08726.1 hypothetical protein EDF39_1123 [Frondihabitans sp. PhB161]